jgi:hypothetical protein
MPTMAYLAHENPEALTRADYIRLAFGTASGARDTLPFSSRFLQRFESEHCYDRYFEGAPREGWFRRRGKAARASPHSNVEYLLHRIQRMGIRSGAVPCPYHGNAHKGTSNNTGFR